MKKTVMAAALGVCALVAANQKTSFVPGKRIEVLAHNAYPDHGKYGDRLDRVIAGGKPFAVEEDLAWIDGKSLLIHGARNVAQDDPTLDSYFFPRVRPLMEKALKEGNKGDWPIVTLYLDIKNDPVEHLEAISKTLDQYSDWLTTAAKPANDSEQAPLRPGPMMALVEDKQQDIKQDFFYDRVPVGGTIRVFGSVKKAGPPTKLSEQQEIDYMHTLSPEQVITSKANTYRRWIGLDWAIIEKGGEHQTGDLTSESEARLHKFVDYGHRMGYLVSIYCLDGYTQDENQGWDKDYNVGSKELVAPRWNATVRARPDFVSTDQYEDVLKVIETTHGAK
jgi:hypothetical protein